MAHRLLVILPVFALLVASVSGQGRGGGPPLPTEPQLAWTVDTDFQAPESAYYDADSNSIYVSNINGQVLEKDGNGYISRLSADGRLIKAQWATGLNAPKGMRAVNGTLWVTDIDEVVGIDTFRATVTERVRIEGAQFLNDLAAAPDGTLYVSDSQLSRVYTIRDGKASVFVEGKELDGEQPNGVLVDGARLLVGTMGPAGAGGRGRGAGGAPPPSGKLFAFDRTSRQRRQVTTENVGGVDGIERDGNGGLLVTDVFGSRLLYVRPDGTVRTLMTFKAAGADIGYVAWRRHVVVPFLFANSVSGYDVTYVIP